MYKSSKTGEDVDVYLSGTVSLLDDLRKLITYKIDGNNIVKSVCNPSALNDVNMIDLRLNV